jgi:ABC-type lipoprotein export system ATPase subunit
MLGLLATWTKKDEAPAPVAKGDEVLRVEALTKTYGQGETAVRVLHGIDLSLRAGDLTLVMGPSGSGKTTLVSILGLLLRPTSGRVLVQGHDVTGLDERTLPHIRRKKVAFVFQAFNLFESLTAIENVEMGLSLAGIPARLQRERAAELLAQVGLGDRGHHVPQDLSGGQKQRVAIARALGSPGSILLADEPTGALDSQNGQRVMALLRGAADAGRAVVVVTHDPRLEALADRIVHIEDGLIHSDVRVSRSQEVSRAR